MSYNDDLNLNQKLTNILKKARKSAKNRKTLVSLECYRKACELAPRNPSVWQEAGAFAIANGDVKRGVEALFRAGDLYAQAGTIELAMALCKQVLSIDGDHRGARSIIRMTQRRAALQRLSQLADSPTSTEQPTAGKIFSAPALTGLDIHMLRQIVQVASPISVSPGESAFSQGDPGTSLFLVIQGAVEVATQRGDVRYRVAKLKPGSIFGEMAFLGRLPRTATVTATQSTLLLELTERTIQSLIRKNASVLEAMVHIFQERMIDNLVTTSPFFRQLSVDQRRTIAAQFRICNVPGSQIVVTENVATTDLFLVLAGQLDVWTKHKGKKVSLGSLEPGDVFGEMSMLEKRAASATISSDLPVWLMKLPRPRFEPLMEEYPTLRAGLKLIAKSRSAHNQRVLGKARQGPPSHLSKKSLPGLGTFTCFSRVKEAPAFPLPRLLPANF